MKRCLHITIHESLNAAQAPGTAYPHVRPGTDPGTLYVVPEPDDPGTLYVVPEPDDPGTLYVVPEPDDPSGNPYPSGGLGGGGAVTVHDCECAAPAGPKPAAGSGEADAPHPFVAPRDYSGFVVVRMAEGIGADSPAASLWHLAEEHQPKLTGLREVLESAVEAGKAEPVLGELSAGLEPPSGVLASRALVELQGPADEKCSPPRPLPLPRDESLRLIREMEKKAATTAFPPLHSLTSYWRLDLREHPGLVEKVVAGLNRLAEVDLAYRELAAGDPQLAGTAGRHFAEDQGYLDDAPVGIGAFWALESLNGTASSTPKVTLCDLEQGWNTGHQELTSLPSSPFFGANRASDEGRPGHHGTAVLGQLAAMGQRIKGVAADLGQFVLASHYRSKDGTDLPGTNGHVAEAIAQALKPDPGTQLPLLREGSILLLEVQRGLLPTEIDEADFDAIRLASAHGVIVVEAAGNGGFDLDAYTDPVTRRSLRRGAPGFRDSGAILVGAARASLPHDRAPFSNYGSRLDCFGWGEAVTTCGYGDLAGTVDTDFYTNAFSGTSSASPIIAGAAALVQALHQERTGYCLEPRAMRALLSDPETGTRQGPNAAGHIGVMPDLQAVVRGRLKLVPDVYMRRHAGDHGSKPGREEEISSSPDILLWTGKPEEAGDRFGEGPRANVPALGNPLNPADPNSVYSSGGANASRLYVRLRNRGVGTGKAKVQLFASPAATLITPERWMPVGFVEAHGIEQGDRLTVSTPLPVNLRQKWPQKASEPGIVPAFSFLAVQFPESGTPSHVPGYEQPLLPPGPPYFDWTGYRSFLRGPGVAWRNVHPIKVKGVQEMTLAFLIAGTPDQARHFDFEVIQRLPEKAEVALEVPLALAAKLRQRLPWLPNGPEDLKKGLLKLPRRPRTALGRVALAPGACAPAAFKVVAGPSPLLRGHSLAIRQLWRGEEVGRITWWFVTE
ncbi:MAG TPA: S8 family serine peptidase [Thermoanaerobaculia bacterium]|nr:S8 family serine peptidase [Thermoanaerobaculia bacterium]